MADADSVRDAYVTHGPRGFYERFGDAYRNPHEPAVVRLIEAALAEWPVDASNVLDLAAGSGEATLAILECSRPACPPAKPQRIAAIDPYTGAAYESRTGRACEKMSFEQIAAGGLRGRAYSLVVCSFALHLVEPSRLPTLCWELAGVALQLLILTPHKRPVIDAAWGWSLTHERLRDRVRARLYASQAASQPAAKGLS